MSSRLRRAGVDCAAAGVALGLLVALAACDHSSQISPTPVCSYALSPQDQTFASSGGPGSFAVATDAVCTWSVQGAADWVALQQPASGTGAGTVRFSVLPNADLAARHMTLTVGAVLFRVNQDGAAPCTFSISPDTQAMGNEGGSAEAAVTAAAGCSWTAASSAPWITITSGAQGQGTGTVKYGVGPNNAPTARTGTLTIANHTLTVNQKGERPGPGVCSYSVSPVTLSPCMPGGRLTATITTEASCTWTASAGVSWLSLPGGASGAGPAVLSIAFSDNYDAPREGAVMVRWPTPTQGQNIHVAQAGCVYAVSRGDFNFASAGGSGTFDVIQQSQPILCGGPLQDQCVWTARASASWITITSGMPRSGDNPVAFSVAANTGAARSATITVRDKVVTIAQDAP